MTYKNNYITWKKHTILTDFSKSQSSKMIKGDFPPSSNETFLRFESDDAFMIACPVAVLPVKPIFLISGCSDIALPVSLPFTSTVVNTNYHLEISTFITKPR